MFRLLLRPALLLTLLATLPIVLIRAQPYDDSELRAFLTPPEGCPAPCFMGIRPGVTTGEEAMVILEAHEWVAAVDGDGMPSITWKWNDIHPEWINEKVPGDAWINARNGLVMEIQVETFVSLGDILLTLGNPNPIRLGSDSGMSSFMWLQDGWYRGKGMRFYVTGCAIGRADLYSNPTLLLFNEVSSDAELIIATLC